MQKPHHNGPQNQQHKHTQTSSVLQSQNSFCEGCSLVWLREYLLPLVFPIHTSKPASASKYGSDWSTRFISPATVRNPLEHAPHKRLHVSALSTAPCCTAKHIVH